MRTQILFLFPLILFLFSCTEEGASPAQQLSDSSSYSVTATEPLPAKKPFYSPEFRKAVLSALSRGYTLVNPDTFELIPEGEYFSLINPQSVFFSQQMIYFRQGESARVRLRSTHDLVLEERTLLSTKDLDDIMAAISKPLANPREQRFLNRPFTFWQYKSAICHIYTTNESDRKKMDVAYELWIGFQTPKE